MTRRAFILGGSGQIGRAAALNLLEAGWEVTVGQRHGDLPEALAGRIAVTVLDREDDSALRNALARPFDAVLDTVAYNAVHARQWLALQDHIGTLAVISTGSVYVDDEGRALGDGAQYPIPLREDQRRAPPGEAHMSAAAALGYRPITDYVASAPALCAALVEEAHGKDWLTAFPGLAAYPPQMFEAPPAQ